MTVDDMIAASRERDLFIVLSQRSPGVPAGPDNSMVVFIPQGWGDAFDDPYWGGPSHVDDDTGEPSPELRGYGFVGEGTTETGYDTIYWKIVDLLAGQEVTEVVAKQIDPGLFDHLNKINRGEI